MQWRWWTDTSRWHWPQIITDCGNLTLDFKQLGLRASPPFLQTLGPWFPNEIQNLLSSEKRTLDQLGNSPVLLLLAQVRRPLTTTVSKFLDTSVCGALDSLDPSLSPFLVKFTQILELIFLDNPHKAAVLSVGCASFPSTQLSVNMLGYSTLWTASLVMNVCVFSSLWRVSMIVFWTTVRSAVFPMIVSPSEPNWDHFEDSGNLCRCFELIIWSACHHIIISWDSELVGFC